MLHGKGKPKPKLSVGRYYLAGTNNGADYYAFFAGGYASYDNGGYSAVVDAFDSQMVQYTPEPLKEARYQFAATHNGANQRAIFLGGRKGSTISSMADYYTSSLTHSSGSIGTSRKWYNLTATHNTFAFFAGGENSSGCSNEVYIFDASATMSTASTLSYSRTQLAAATVDNYAFFGGGYNSAYSGTVKEQKTLDVYNNSATKVSTSNTLNIARKQLAATNVGKYVLFGGGHGDGTLYPSVDAFDKSLTRTVVDGLSKARMNLTATTANGKAFFAGGEMNSTKQDVVDCYDASLTHTVEKPLSVARYGLASTALGNKAIFAGGYGTNPSYSDAIDIYS
jgi:kelch-like protein 20